MVRNIFKSSEFSIVACIEYHVHANKQITKLFVSRFSNIICKQKKALKRDKKVLIKRLSFKLWLFSSNVQRN